MGALHQTMRASQVNNQESSRPYLLMEVPLSFVERN